MNKRIQELVELCTVQYRDGHGEYVDQVDVEKFAELIVKECAKLVEDNIDPENAWITPAYIKEHFGVK